MKKLLLTLILISSVAFVYSQAQGQGDKLAFDKLVQLTTVRLSGFEDASFWKVYMPIDMGIIVKRTRQGAPLQVEDPKDAEGNQIKEDDPTYAEKLVPNHISLEDKDAGIPRNYERKTVLGVKVMYISRGHNWFTVRPIKPIVIEGVTHSLSVYIACRNYKHFLKVAILDFFGRERLLPVDYLKHPGWKRFTINVPGEKVIKQWDHRFPHKRGIKFNGFLVECEPSETFGTYYMYFDELRARTDIFSELTKDKDDMEDNW